jgi:cytochrome c biogenesis protein CcmG/thiol:disulfide interchange protein DsbE
MKTNQSSEGWRRTALAGLSLALCFTAEHWDSSRAISAQLVQQASPKTAPTPGRPASSFDLTTLDGKNVNLETFRGKPLVLNFFASWCDPCREEMPLLNELAAQGVNQGYNVLGIAVEDTRAAVAEFAKQAKLKFPIALDLNSTVKRSYRIFGPPATFANGIVRDVVLGPVTSERARDALKKAGIDY